MRLFFWDYDDYNDISRQWSMFIINLLAFAFTAYSLYRTAQYHGKILFELFPLSINTLATLILLLIKLFEKGYQFDLVGYVIQIFTYFLFCYTFSLLHARLLMKQKLPINKLCNFLLIAFTVGSIVIIVLVVCSVIGRNCDNNLVEASLGGFITQLVSFIPTLYFGWDILRNMARKHRQQKEQEQQSNQSKIVFESVSDRYIKQRQKQIQLVLIAYTISLVLRGIVLIFNFSWEQYITCMQCQGVYILTSDQALGQFMLILIEINQLIPHLIIPIALYIIPLKNTRKSTELNFNSTLLEEQQQEQDHSDVLQRRISQKIQIRGSFSPNKSISEQ